MDTILNADFSDVIMNYRILEPDEKGRPGAPCTYFSGLHIAGVNFRCII